MITIKLPWVVVVEIETGDDAVPWAAEHFAVEEVDDEILVGGQELEARRERASHDQKDVMWVSTDQ